MWDALHMSQKADPEFAISVADLLRSTSRSMILVVGGVDVLVLLLTAILSGRFPQTPVNVYVVIFVVAMVCLLALRLLPQRYLTAHLVWQIGLAGAIALAVYLLQRPEIAFLSAALPMVAAVAIGWPAGLIAVGLAGILAWWLPFGLINVPLPLVYRLEIVVAAIIALGLGWASTHAFLTLTWRSLDNQRNAQRRMEEALEQRVQLKQTQQDLVQANQELARLSDRLRAMYRIAEEARRAKEEFVANVSHELRTPLNMIIGFSDMIVQSPHVYGAILPSALLTDIAAIHRNSQHLSKLVDDVLDLSQVEAGRMALSKEWSSLQEIVEEAALAVNALFVSKGIYLKTELPTELPLVFFDSTRIRQVVINLLSNAGRFTEQGGVHVRAWCRDSEIVVGVADTGPGIAQEDQGRLFEPFQQLDSSVRRRHGGSGLGLSISKRFVDMHEGKMWLESEVGVGTTIYFSLPQDAGPPLATAGGDVMRWFSPYHQYEERAQRSQAPPPNVVPRYVLLEKGHMLRRLLSRYMHDVEVASFRNPQEAIGDLSRLPARALVVNASPYEKSPIPAQELINLPYGTLAVSCWIPGEEEAVTRLGVVGYLVKPVTSERLTATLEKLGEGIESVLLVDDDPEVLQLFGRMLALAGGGYRVLRARTGQRALDLLRERHPDAMLLDLFMPGMDGFQVLQSKGNDPSIRDIPVVIISARDPSGASVVSSSITVTRSGGLSANDLLSCIEAVSAVLAPPERPDSAQPKNIAG